MKLQNLRSFMPETVPPISHAPPPDGPPPQQLIQQHHGSSTNIKYNHLHHLHHHQLQLQIN